MTTSIRIVNVYNNEALPRRGLESGHGVSYHITEGGREIFFDVGRKSRKLMHNIRKLGINIDNVEKLVLSHGHADHSGGLVSFLKSRTAYAPLPVVAHPDALEKKVIKKWGLPMNLGLPKLGRRLAEKVKFELPREPVEVLPSIHTTGEIPLTERPEKPGIASRVLHRVNGKLEWDPVVDDLSLVLQAQDGLVILTGCCHAGLLNTCAKVTKLFGSRIKAIVGGAHMLEYSADDVDHVADVLRKRYETPELYLNHCTGKEAVEQLRSRLGPNVVHNCPTGTELMFET